VFARATAGTALLGIPIAVLVPGSIPLVWLAVVSLPANSPLSPIVPTAFEPLIMEAAKHQSVWAVSLVATGMYLYSEYINWHVYAWVLSWSRLRGLQDRRSVRWGLEHFARAPFTTTVVFAITPLPFWVVRSLAVLNRFSLPRFLAATAVGRLPRFVFYAWLGDVLQVPTVLLLAVIVGTSAIVIAGRLARRQPLLNGAAPPSGGDGRGGTIDAPSYGGPPPQGNEAL
jgi:membrane protein YqaA with SNARE-associated domain